RVAGEAGARGVARVHADPRAGPLADRADRPLGRPALVGAPVAVVVDVVAQLGGRRALDGAAHRGAARRLRVARLHAARLAGALADRADRPLVGPEGALVGRPVAVVVEAVAHLDPRGGGD